MTGDATRAAAADTYTRVVAWLPALIALALGLPRLASDAFCLDDAYIHLAYVRSLKLGEGLSYNPYDWAAGVTSPLWVLLLAAWPADALGGVAIKLFGLAFHALGARAAQRLAGCLAASERGRDDELGSPQARGLAPREFAGLGAGALWAATPLALQGATSGMEVSLASWLALEFSRAHLQRRYALAALLAAAGYCARPELSVYVALLALGTAALERRPRSLLPLLAATGAALACAIYYYRVSGHPLPNTYYAKAHGFELGQLRYLAAQVLAPQPVVCSVFGLGLAVLALIRAWRRRRFDLPLVAFAASATLLAIACSRALYSGVTFALSRYFVPLLWVLPLLAALGAAELPKRWATPSAFALAALSAALALHGAALQQRQELGVLRLHVEPARFVAAHVPAGSVLGVEGAGALRLFTPRSLRVIDIVGLNDDRLAHARGDPLARLCYLRAQGMTHVAYPEAWLAFLARGFELRTLASFREPHYAQIDPPQDWTVLVAQVERVKPDFAQRCELRRR